MYNIYIHMYTNTYKLVIGANDVIDEALLERDTLLCITVAHGCSRHFLCALLVALMCAYV